MRICLLLDPSRCLRWHLWIAQALSEKPGYSVVVRFTADEFPLPQACRLVLDLERLIFGLARGCATDLVGEVELTRCCQIGSSVDRELDLVINLAGHQEQAPSSERVLTLAFNGYPTEIGALSQLLESRSVLVEVHDSDHPDAVAQARPAVTDQRILAKALDNVLSCATELILKIVSAPSIEAAMSGARGQRYSPRALDPPSTIVSLSHLARRLAWKSRRFLHKFLTGAKTWAVAWRFSGRDALVDGGNVRLSILPCDDQRYYADPFPYCHRGSHFIFLEEYRFESQRGCISVAGIGPDGPSAPRPIIEEAHHLSYPFVFENDGQIWMMPESGAAGRIDVYRALQFPYVWRREGTLINGIAAYDATLHRHNGEFWIFACVARWNSSTWDNLSIFRAAELFGPWTPSATNPVLLDACASRPAGALFSLNGETFRPAQDCSRIYGGAITLCRVDHLTENAFDQSPAGRIQADALGCHTYNRHGELEVLDVFGAARGSRRVTISCTWLPTEMPREAAA
ncbi:MAG TPA: hypothetical protein VKW08_04610 [Xanthobacteraceae bacterium]|nr:hypothetical protein [Xanthobacteraceae bacterium]